MMRSPQNFLHVLSGFASQKLLGRSWCSVAALGTSPAAVDSLYRRISPIGNPSTSIVPVLDQWIHEGHAVCKGHLQTLIRELSSYRRFKHALEISNWMSDKRYIPLSVSDVVTRLYLISRVYGINQAENYFNNISKNMKTFDVYVALLLCYTHAKCVEKAEEVMEEIRNRGFAAASSSPYNALMKLYYRLENWEKLDMTMHEMEEKGISWDELTLTIRLSAYAAASNEEGINHMVTRIETCPNSLTDYKTYCIAADAYLKVGSVDKALEMLSKSEKLIANAKRKSAAYGFLLRLYARTGKSDQLYRIWDLYRRNGKVYNKGYMDMMASLLKSDDVVGAEKIFEEWEKEKLSYDFRIPNLFIDAYCRIGLLEKAEALVNKGKLKGGIPNFNTWCYLANAYIEGNHIAKAVEALKCASAIVPPEWKPSRETIATCLLYLEGKGDINGSDEFMRSLQAEKTFSDAACDRLLKFIKDRESQSASLFS